MSGLVPHITNLQKSAEMAKVELYLLSRRFGGSSSPFLRKKSA